MAPNRLIPLLLGVACAFTSILLGLEVTRSLSAPATAGLPVSTAAPTNDTGEASAKTRDEIVTAILERPLFSASRRPPQTPEVPVEAPPPPRGPDSRLVGFVTRGGERLAILASAPTGTVFAKIGAEVEPNWQLVTIDGDQVVIRGPAGDVTLEITRAPDLGRVEHGQGAKTAARIAGPRAGKDRPHPSGPSTMAGAAHASGPSTMAGTGRPTKPGGDDENDAASGVADEDLGDVADGPVEEDQTDPTPNRPGHSVR